MVSEKHAGFIVNTGNATADDVHRLIEIIQNTVFKDTGIALETEIKFA
jgi:UDP-N-acetylmuramate dehydrogenase